MHRSSYNIYNIHLQPITKRQLIVIIIVVLIITCHSFKHTSWHVIYGGLAYILVAVLVTLTKLLYVNPSSDTGDGSQVGLYRWYNQRDGK